jgi:hypothetical protein
MARANDPVRRYDYPSAHDAPEVLLLIESQIRLPIFDADLVDAVGVNRRDRSAGAALE